jgi:ElaB/YqjD/DUF883 family membrane-anchored ribosome-binding protein
VKGKEAIMIYGQSQEEIEGILNMLDEATKEKKEEMKSYFDQGRESVQSLVRNVQIEVHDNPWKIVTQAALYGFGLGLLLGSLSGKRTEETE